MIASPSKFRIVGFQPCPTSGYTVRWTDKSGRDHHNSLEHVKHNCELGIWGLKEADFALFEQARDKHLAEMEIGRKIPGRLHHVGERVCEHR